MVDCQLFGLNSGAHHFVNVLLHSVAVLLLFLVLQAMTGSIWRSAFVAAVFAIHPLRAESVAWISERKDVLSGVFFMLTLGAYLRYVRTPSIGRYMTMSGAFALGLMSKPMLVTMPFVFLLLDYWPLGRVRNFRGLGRLIVEKIPLFTLSAISCVATILAQRGTIASVEELPLTLRISNALMAYVTYIWQMICPARLAALYPYPRDIPLLRVALAVLFLALVTASAVAMRRKRPYFMTGWFWYLIMLVPVAGLVQVGIQPRADRYTYLPQIGLYLLVAWGIVDAFGSWRKQKGIMVSAAAIAIAALISFSWRQTSFWRNSESLWTHTLAVTSQNFIAHNNLGNFLLEHNRLDEAIDQFRASAQIEPNYFDAESSWGMALRSKGLTDQAIVHFRRALELQPNESAQSKYAATYNNLGVALTAAGQPAEAIVHLQHALALNPSQAKTFYNLGNAFMETGQLDDAIANYEKALAMQPHYAYAHHNLGTALMRKGEPEAARVQFEKAAEDTPR